MRRAGCGAAGAVDVVACAPSAPVRVSRKSAAAAARRDSTFGFQLYQSDPSGNFGGWKATAVGANHAAAANILKTDYVEGCSLQVRRTGSEHAVIAQNATITR